MLQYIFAGLALGAVYAIAASGLVVTYVSAGVLNFAFGSMAYFIARSYYWLQVQHGWPVAPAAVVSLLLFGPGLGAVLWVLLFRHLRLRTSLVKVVSTIGLAVALPPVADLLFGNIAISQAPGLAPSPVLVLHVFGAAVDLNAIINYAAVIVVLAVGTVVLRYTRVGLRVRSLVESEALTSLSGVNPNRVSLGVWSLSSLLAGLAGVLVAPTNGLTSQGMTVLMAVTFAAVIAAKLRNLAAAVVIALAMGVVTDLVQDYIPPNSSLTFAIVPSIPFGFVLVFLIIEAIRRQRSDEDAARGGVLDRALEVPHAEPAPAATSRQGLTRAVPSLVALLVLAVIPLVTSGFWLGLVAGGFAVALVLLSYTLVTGEGGMMWLCQITFAGLAAIAAAQLVTVYGWSPLPAVLVAAIAVVPIGLVIGALVIRLGALYVAVVTLTLGLLVETLVFTINRFYNFGQGVTMSRPPLTGNDRTFAYLTLVVFLVLALLTINLRRSTIGLALAASRSSETAARTLGLNVTAVKLTVAGLATFVAGLGGGFLAMNYGAAQPDSYATFTGLIWLAVLIAVGLRSIPGLLIGGLSLTLVPGLFESYLPLSWAQVPTILFGLGAVLVALNPEGAVTMHARQLQAAASALLRRRQGDPAQPAGPAAGDAATVQATVKGTR
jgi:branched-chain amino acid transport system permease protein